MKDTRNFPAVRSIALLLVVTPAAVCCTCSADPPPCERFGKTDVVFQGMVVAASASGNGSPLYRVHVEEVFRGLTTGEKEVLVNGGSQSCSVSYQAGQRYVFFAARTAPTLFSGTCSGSFLVQQRTEAVVTAIRQQAAGIGAARLYGRLEENAPADRIRWGNSPGVAGVDLSATAESGKIHATRSNENGEYDFGPLEPGNYVVKARSQTHRSGDPQYQTSLTVGGCAEVNIGMWNRSKLAGQLNGPDNLPLAGVDVELVSEYPLPFVGFFEERVTTDAEGKFVFHEARPGNYFLGVNLARDPTPAQPFPVTFFPGTEDRGKALPIQVGPSAEDSARHDFRIARRLTLRRVKIRAVDGAGNPLSGVRLSHRRTYEAIAYPRGVTTGVDGWASFDAFAEIRYEFFLGKDRLSAGLAIPAGSGDAEIVATLRPPPYGAK